MAIRRETLHPFLTKPGRHGTLFRFKLGYENDPRDPGMGRMDWFTWAYDASHAEDRFYESEDADGWKVVSVEKVRDTSRLKPRGARDRAGSARATRSSR